MIKNCSFTNAGWLLTPIVTNCSARLRPKPQIADMLKGFQGFRKLADLRRFLGISEMA